MGGLCRICRVNDPRPTYPDPCCAAPDCTGLADVVHYECASDYVKKEIRRDKDSAYEESQRLMENELMIQYQLDQEEPPVVCNE